MPDTAVAVLLGFTIFSVKHAIADFFIQTPYQFMNKGTYGHPGGLLHSGIHAVMSAPVFLVLAPVSALAGILLLAGEFIVHYHVDWLKEQVTMRNGWKPDEAWFWRALGLDQLAHMLTYVAMIALLLRQAG